MENTVRKYKIYIDVEPTDTAVSGTISLTGATVDNRGLYYKVKHSDGTLHEFPESDFYVNIPLLRSERVYEYIDVEVEDTVYTVERQEINPYYIEYGFFEGVIQNRIIKGQDFDDENITFIREVRPDVNAAFPLGIAGNEAIKRWYDEYGKFEFPWNEGTSTETTKDDLDNSSGNPERIVSKALNFPIDINN